MRLGKEGTSRVAASLLCSKKSPDLELEVIVVLWNALVRSCLERRNSNSEPRKFMSEANCFDPEARKFVCEANYFYPETFYFMSVA